MPFAPWLPVGCWQESESVLGPPALQTRAEQDGYTVADLCSTEPALNQHKRETKSGLEQRSLKVDVSGMWRSQPFSYSQEQQQETLISLCWIFNFFDDFHQRENGLKSTCLQYYNFNHQVDTANFLILTPALISITFTSKLDVISYWDLLDLSRIGDDLLHNLHGLALGLSCLSLTLWCCSLDNLHLLALTHLHGDRCTLMEGRERRQIWIKAKKKGHSVCWTVTGAGRVYG